MKKALIVLLVLVVLVTGVPILMTMSGMASCHDCSLGLLASSCVLAIITAGIALVTAGFTQRVRGRLIGVRVLLHSFLLERPPRLA